MKELKNILKIILILKLLEFLENDRKFKEQDWHPVLFGSIINVGVVKKLQHFFVKI